MDGYQAQSSWGCAAITFVKTKGLTNALKSILPNNKINSKTTLKLPHLFKNSDIVYKGVCKDGKRVELPARGSVTNMSAPSSCLLSSSVPHQEEGDRLGGRDLALQPWTASAGPGPLRGWCRCRTGVQLSWGSK